MNLDFTVTSLLVFFFFQFWKQIYMMLSTQSYIIISNLNKITKQKPSSLAFYIKPGNSLLPLRVDAVKLGETTPVMLACLWCVHYESLMSSSKTSCLLQRKGIFLGFVALFQGREHIRTKNKYLLIRVEESGSAPASGGVVKQARKAPTVGLSSLPPCWEDSPDRAQDLFPSSMKN